MVGREASLPIPKSRRRERGYVAETVAGGVLVRVYPTPDHDWLERVVDPADVRLLKARVPSGWREVDLVDEAGEPVVALRLSEGTVRALDEAASRAEVSFERFCERAIVESLERLSEA